MIKETNNNLYSRHGEGSRKLKSEEYKTWAAMKQRCFQKSHKNFKDYQGRGITVCPEWKNSFPTFLLDMGRKPTPLHTLDRIDNNGDYCPKNCKWSTRKEQAKNRRVRIDSSTGIAGVNYSKRQNKFTVRINDEYLGSYDSFFEACCVRKSAELTR